MGQTEAQPVHYHIFMSRISTVYHRFCNSIRNDLLPPVEAVRVGDEALAEIIITLPKYLQPESAGSDRVREIESAQPWVKWQRFGIAVLLLHYRMRLHRALQYLWMSTPESYGWARSVCIKSAVDIIWINRNWDQPLSMRKQWYVEESFSYLHAVC